MVKLKNRNFLNSEPDSYRVENPTSEIKLQSIHQFLVIIEAKVGDQVFAH
jgi:hypothetical protein